MTTNVEPIEKSQAPYSAPMLADEMRPLSQAWLIYFNQMHTILVNIQEQIDDLQSQIDAL